ncbi:SNF2-related protein [Macrophomina phaseolina MS6]|uniref:SNF2-related protein n=1 Tax=Macrophomina phaseolina (strain MS6) TaxID=1126212 RepID=K2RDJ4_MACPH|nr:SNF2-related protein [Macrophomina phaseolina MS6]
MSLGINEDRQPATMESSANVSWEDTFSVASKQTSSAATSAISTSALTLPLATLTKTSEEEALLGDLQNYIPLGSLLLREQHGVSSSTRTWMELDISQHTILNGLGTRLRESVTDLLEARWLRAEFATPTQNSIIVRFHVLPHDLARRFVDRSIRKLQIALGYLVQEVSVSADLWHGKFLDGNQAEGTKFDRWATAEDSSLFYLFNTLPSPFPEPGKVEDPYAREAMQDILDARLTGLTAKLYPFQARSAAMMLQREASQELFLDPRLETRTAPNGSEFYYCPRDVEFLQSPRLYASNRSGILAEGMGRGKTIIAISLILATKHHLPKISPEYQTGPPARPKTGSLFQMAAAATGRHSIPWKAAMARHEEETGEELTECIRELTFNPPRYEIPAEPVRFNRKTAIPPPREMTMCSGTIIVVPRNLLHQWQSELQKHVEEGRLKVLVMDSPRKALPPPPELVTYEVVLFSRSRFEQEIRDGSDEQGRRPAYSTPPACQCPYIGATRTRSCTCLRIDALYVSPLKNLHWLRIMIDEGHNFSSPSSNAVLVAQQLVHAERRWVISGTPAKDDLLGVDMDFASDDSPGLGIENDAQALRDKVLKQRKRYGDEDARGAGASKSLGQLATYFLQVRPWANANYEERADWMDYVYRHKNKDDKRRTFHSYSLCMKRALEQLIIKTQPYDVEKDLVLPPLTHRVVRLAPSFYDKVSANLFILVLTANAVTSERTDIDYLFHPRSKQARNQLITNLRQSNFFWTGFSETDIGNAVEHGCKYLLKEEAQCSDEDRQLLTECINFAENFVLSSESWKAMSATHEVGLFVDSWPGNTSHAWALVTELPELYGITQLLQAQTYVNERLGTDPMEGFEAAGKAALEDAFSAEAKTAKINAADDEMKMGLPSSSVHVEVNVSKLHTPTKKVGSTPKAGNKKNSTKASGPTKKDTKEAKTEASAPTEPPRKRLRDSGIELIGQSPLRRTQVIGTVSAKLTYLLGQIMTYYQEEKILVFYDGDNAAYYIAQCLDLLGVPHEIYSKGISNELRSRYIVNFDKDPMLRVLLMDVRLGALGLNVNQASRVYFINPVCRPSTEAQAVKRAHRIGQTKPVYVETLILTGTIEEAMFERSKTMTRNEHMEAKTLEDDQMITDIIKNARLLPVDPEEAVGERRMAPLEKSEQLFGRPGRGAMRRGGGGGSSAPQAKKQKRNSQSSQAKQDGAQILGVVGRSVVDPPPGQRWRESFASVVEETMPLPTRPSIFGGA